MKRRSFLIALGVVPHLVFKSCKGKNKLPKTPTIISGYVKDEKQEPIKGLKMEFGGNTGGVNAKLTFNQNTLTDEKGYYYLEQLIPENTVSIAFKVIDISNNNVLYDYLCSVEEAYQKGRPFIVGKKSNFNFNFDKV